MPLIDSGPRPGPLNARTWGIIWPFLAIVAVLVIVAHASIYVLSGARGYVTGESIWSKAQKEAVYNLLRYSQTHAEADFEHFRSALSIPLADRRARLEMDKPDMDYAVVARGLLDARTHPDDIPNVIFLYRNFGQVGFMQKVVRIWIEGDRHIDSLLAEGEALHAAVLAAGGTEHPLDARLERIYAIDAALTPMEHAFSSTMGDAARTTQFLLMLLTIATAASMVPIGVYLSRRMVAKGLDWENATLASEERFNLAVSGSNDGVWDWNIARRDLYVSPRFRELAGLAEGTAPVAIARIIERIHWEDSGPARRTILRQARLGQMLRIELRMRAANGEFRWFAVRGQAIRDASGKIVRMVGSMTDMTDRKQAEEQLFAERDRLHVTLQAIGDAVVTTDPAGAVQYLNPTAEQLTGHREADVRELPLGKVCRLVDEATGRPLLDRLDLVDGRRQIGSLNRTTLVREDGSSLAVSAVIAPMRDAHQMVAGFVVVLHDVSRERRYAADLAHQASHDALTGLINRREFEERLRLALDSAREDERSHAVLYLDLDQFKVVNDTSGHAAGDELIKQVSLLLLQRLRKTDTLARLGGDEFGALLENCSSDEAMRIAEDLRNTVVEFRFAWRGQPFTVGASIGVVNVRDTALTPESVMSIADAACYLAKEKGRNRVQLYRPDDSELVKRRGEMEWVGRIREALETNAFRLYAQEIAPIGATRTSGAHVELLVRMSDGNGGIIPPMAFIPAAERYDLMPDIDRWVVHNAFETIARRRSGGRRDAISMYSLNLSGATIGDARFLDFVLGEFERYRLPFEAICFEVTETSAIASLGAATEFMTRMQNVGCCFALDDFGSGMSSFGYLKQLPVDYLKIDGAFVRDILTDPMDRLMVEAINHVGHRMGKMTIAEFVENDAIRSELEQIGVDFAQGYGIGRPVPFTDVLEFAQRDMLAALAG